MITLQFRPSARIQLTILMTMFLYAVAGFSQEVKTQIAWDEHGRKFTLRALDPQTLTLSHDANGSGQWTQTVNYNGDFHPGSMRSFQGGIALAGSFHGRIQLGEIVLETSNHWKAFFLLFDEQGRLAVYGSMSGPTDIAPPTWEVQNDRLFLIGAFHDVNFRLPVGFVDATSTNPSTSLHIPESGEIHDISSDSQNILFITEIDDSTDDPTGPPD